MAEVNPDPTIPVVWHTYSMGDTHRVRVGPKGRLVIPAPIRDELGLEEGTEMACFVEDGAVVLATDEALQDQLQAMFAHIDHSLADELIAERRAEAEREKRLP